MIRNILALAPLALLACVVPSAKNNGLDDQLSFYVLQDVPIAVGAVLPVEVAHSPKSVAVCNLAECTPPVVGSSDLTPVSELVSASCDDGACRVDDATVGDDGWLHFDLTGLAAGKTTLHVTLKLQNGDAYSDRMALTFVAPTAIAADLYDDDLQGETPGDVTAPFGSHYAIFPGANVVIAASATGLDDSGSPILLNAGALSATSSNPSAARVTSTGSPTLELSVQAIAPGTTTLTVAGAGMKRDLTLRVADPRDVESAELRDLLMPPSQRACVAGGGPGACFDWDDDTLAQVPASGSVSTSEDPIEAVVLRLHDGTFAVGGAGFLSSSNHAVLGVDTLSTSDVAPSDGDRMALPRIMLRPEAAGTATVSGTIAGVAASFPFEVH